jgi:hypothetical protein
MGHPDICRGGVRVWNDRNVFYLRSRSVNHQAYSVLSGRSSIKRLVKKTTILPMFGVVVAMRFVMAPAVPPVVMAIMILEEYLCRNFYKGSAIDLVRIFCFDPNASALSTIISKSFRHQ